MILIISGTQSISLPGTKQVTINQCTECKCSTFTVNVVQCYKHIFYIPIYPLEKIFYLTCDKCKILLQMNNKKKYLPQYSFKEFKTPIWLYTTPAILFAFVAYSFYRLF